MKELKIKVTQLFILLVFLVSTLTPLAVIKSLEGSNQTMSNSSEQEDLVWFYENLTPSDRRKIRQAMDYAIPRDTIIANIMQGYGEKIVSPIRKQ